MLLSLILGILILGGVAALVLNRCERTAARIGCGSAVAALLGYGAWALLNFNRLLFFYQLPVIVTGIAAACFAPAYLKGHGSERGGWFWCFFNWTLAAMIGVIEAQTHFLTFLIAWELMGLCSFALVAFERGEEAVRRAGWGYLAACEAGGLALMLASPLLAGGEKNPLLPYLLLLGFGLKAGFPLLHTWLPEAHPAAPAPVSAVMSGAMIPLGFCGFFRFLPAGYSTSVGWTLLALGTIGALGGILCGAVQNNLKRLLAYSSIENIGIITLGFALALLTSLSRTEQRLTILFLAYTGAVFHVVNHALLKGSLFLGAGAVLKCTGTLKIDSLGGLQQKMPWTARLFTLQSLGICGLPPFAGFTGELLIYTAAFYAILYGETPLRLAGLLVTLTLALTGAVAGVAFAKAAGTVFLGEPRTAAAREAAPESRGLVGPVMGLTALSLLMPFGLPFYALHYSYTVIIAEILGGYAVLVLAVYFLIFILRLLRRTVGGNAPWRTTGTWDCGYARPTARMQYTGTAFVQPLADLCDSLLKQQKMVTPPRGYFPQEAGMEVTVTDPAVRTLGRPAGKFLQGLADRIHRLQSGYLHLYILVMVLALAAMLIWSCFYGEGR